MKTKLLVAFSALTLAPLARAADTPAACACCAAPQISTAPVTDRSLFQLDATWTTDAGQPIQLASFRGRPVVLTMFFASCTYACPIIVGDLQRIRAALPADARAKTQFVLVSFDSARDTPTALRAYRTRANLDGTGWTLLHGAPADVQELAMLLGVKYKQDASGQFSHSNLITVLNAEGEIVHQRPGLQGEIADAVHAITVAAK